MNICCRCRRKQQEDDLDDFYCERCGGGIVEVEDEDELDFISEYDSDGF